MPCLASFGVGWGVRGRQEINGWHPARWACQVCLHMQPARLCGRDGIQCLLGIKVQSGWCTLGLDGA